MEEPRLHICLSPDCNNNCIFCMEEDRQARRRRLNLLDREQVEAALKTGVDLGSVMFTAGEPTLHPDLPDLLGLAKRLGYRSIGLISNGRRLAYGPYADHLVRMGLNHAVISLHGHTARLHDGLTRTPGSFEQTVAGLENLGRYQRSGGFRLYTSTVLNRRNLPHLQDILGFILARSVDEAVLNAIQPLGRGASHFERLVPSYSEMIDALLQALNSPGLDQARVRLVDVPPCILRRLPSVVRGEVEEHHHFEPREGLPNALAAEAADGEPLIPVDKKDYDRVQRSFGPPCDGCPLRAGCDGVWSRYVQERGWSEFGVIKDDPGP